MRIYVYDDMFQFPSNGKAYTKPNSLINPVPEYESFNSLQTGKHIQRDSIRRIIMFDAMCFNSLQTGKHIQSENENEVAVELVFQFPSNGKAYTKDSHESEKTPLR